MKQPKKLTRSQKEVLSAHNLKADNWMLVAESEFYITVIHKKSKQIKKFDKFWKGGRRK